VRTTGRDRLRVAGVDAGRWAGAHARGLARGTGAVLKVVIPAALIFGMIAGTAVLRPTSYDRRSTEIDLQLRELEAIQRRMRENMELIRRLSEQRAWQQSHRAYVPVATPQIPPTRLPAPVRSLPPIRPAKK
jgi:hypothetical protein